MSALTTRPISLLPPGTAFSRFIQALGRSGGDAYRAQIIASDWRDTPTVLATLEGLATKAAVPAGSTTDATWAGPLSAHGIASEALTLLRGLSIVGALEGRMRRVPLHVKLAHETGDGVAGGWVAAGNAIRVQKTAFEQIIQEHYKFGVIVPVTRELVRVSSPEAETTIRQTVLGGLAAALDNQFLLASVAASAGVNPASVTNGATEVTSTGTTSAQIAADLGAMLAAVSTPGPYVWIMKPATLYRIALTIGSQAAGLPATLFGIPVIASISSPAQITLLDPSGILYSDSGQFEIEVSDQASIQLDDAPTNPPTAATVMMTSWAHNLVYVRALRWLAWLRTEAGAAAWMTVAY